MDFQQWLNIFLQRGGQALLAQHGLLTEGKLTSTGKLLLEGTWQRGWNEGYWAGYAQAEADLAKTQIENSST